MPTETWKMETATTGLFEMLTGRFLISFLVFLTGRSSWLAAREAAEFCRSQLHEKFYKIISESFFPKGLRGAGARTRACAPNPSPYRPPFGAYLTHGSRYLTSPDIYLANGNTFLTNRDMFLATGGSHGSALGQAGQFFGQEVLWK